jgi:hypothetical protein
VLTITCHSCHKAVPSYDDVSFGAIESGYRDLANACLDYLNYDWLGNEVHKHLRNGARALHRWLKAYRIEPAFRS